MGSLTPAQEAELDNLLVTNGEITTASALGVARDPNSALHQHPAYLGWDPARLIDAQLKDATRFIVRSYWISQSVTPGGPYVPMRCTFSMQVAPRDHTYRATSQILVTDPALIVDTVLDRLEGILRSYPMPQLNLIWDAIRDVRRGIHPPGGGIGPTPPPPPGSGGGPGGGRGGGTGRRRQPRGGTVIHAAVRAVRGHNRPSRHS
jgi:hypothetical protein